MIGTYFSGYHLSIDWEVVTTAEVIQFPAWTLKTKLAIHEIIGEKYLLTEQYVGGNIKRNLVVDQLILGLMWLGLCIILSASTYLGRYPFFAVLVLFVLFINRLNLFEVGLYGIETKMVVAIPFMLFATPLVIFHEYQKKTSFLIRLGALILATFILILGIGDYPLFTDHLIAHSMFGFSICGLIFLFLISEEIVFGILYVTSGKGGKSNHIHFSILGLLYLGNLILYYLNKSGLFKNDFHYFDPYILLLISCFIAIWSITFKAEALKKNVPSNIFYILFLGLGITTMFFLSFHMIRGNDGVLEAFHYFILYFHLGFGVLFFLYIIGNFIDPLIRGFEIFKIIYKERNFPYATARLGGLVAILAFYFLSSQEPYNLLRAGYFNYLSIEAKNEGDKLLAREYLLQASFLGYNTHFANYSLGCQERIKGDAFSAKSYFQSASKRFPSSYALINYGNLDQEININKVQANYEEVLRKKPNGEIGNNLGLIHLEKNNLDQALRLFENNISSNKWNDAPLVNKWYVLEKLGDVDTSSLSLNYQKGGFGVKSNIVSSQKQSALLEFDYEKLAEANLLHRQGYLLNSSYLFDHDSIEAFIRREVDGSSNATTNFRLRKALSIHLYQKGDINEAFMMLDYLQANSHQAYKGEYLNALGKFALDQGAYKLALDFFNQALEVKHKHSIFGKIDALAQLNRKDEITSELLVFLRSNPELTDPSNQLLENLEDFTPRTLEAKAIPILDTLPTERLVDLGRKNAFQEQQIIAVINELKNRDASGGYEILVDAIEINPYSIPLLTAYAFHALDWSLNEYADQTMDRLKELLTPGKFQALNNSYQKKKEELKDLEW